jgi:REP element-mobilizing transposase RayT
MIGAFKSITTDEYIRGVREEGWPRFSETFWQRNFYEHIVRN